MESSSKKGLRRKSRGVQRKKVRKQELDFLGPGGLGCSAGEGAGPQHTREEIREWKNSEMSKSDQRTRELSLLEKALRLLARRV